MAFTDKFTIHSDVAYKCSDVVFGWAYLILINDKLAFGPITGRNLKIKGNPEKFPLMKALKRLMVDRELPPNLTIYTDSVEASKAMLMDMGLESNRVNSRNPYHLLCHYASRDVMLKGSINRLESQVSILRRSHYKADNTIAVVA